MNYKKVEEIKYKIFNITDLVTVAPLNIKLKDIEAL